MSLERSCAISQPLNHDNHESEENSEENQQEEREGDGNDSCSSSENEIYF